MTAAGTDAWIGTRTTVARLLGRDGQREEAVLQRLDQTAADLARASEEEAQGALERVRVAQSLSWETRFTDLLQDLPEPERDEAVRALHSLVEHVRQHARGSGASAGTGGFAATGDVIMKAAQGSVVAGVVNGDVRLDPPRPGAAQD
ncbi:hypothetical protein ABZ876_20105 [Streptomyces sp. NPDC046931]|uniref:hypothetical protein n=1 Tax=Streptomyces sp. NPDC046931 TaxID=3154806 RepID=UPI0033FC97F5